MKTFEDGIEAAAKWHDDEAAFYLKRANDPSKHPTYRYGNDLEAANHKQFAASIRLLATGSSVGSDHKP